MRCGDNPEDCYREGLKEWLGSGERSWGDLVEALCSPTVGRRDIAMVINKDYILSAGSPAPLVKQTGMLPSDNTLFL